MLRSTFATKPSRVEGKRLRITIILGPFLPVPTVLGGAVEKMHLQLARAYRAAGHKVTIISRKYKHFLDEENIDGIRYLRVASFNRKSSLAFNLVMGLWYDLRVSQMLPESDITITNSFFLPLLLPRRIAGKIYVHVARFPKRQMILYYRADRLQAVSHAVAEAIVQQTPRLANKVVSIGNAIPDAYFQLSPRKPKKKIILFVGRLAREKGVHLLVKAFALLLKNNDHSEMSEWKLRIVGPHDVIQGGSGPDYFNELTRLAQPLGSACELAGPIFEERSLINEYRSASVFCYPSMAERGEALPLAPLEAMASGCAVVVSNLRCFEDYIENGVNGLTFEYKSPDPVTELGSRLARLMSETQLIERFAKNAKMAARKFQTTEIAEKMMDDFELVARN